MSFQHVPVQSLEDTTANFEQWQRLLERIKLIPLPSEDKPLKELLEALRAF